MTTKPCDTCNGSGEGPSLGQNMDNHEVFDHCPDCGGSGVTPDTESSVGNTTGGSVGRRRFPESHQQLFMAWYNAELSVIDGMTSNYQRDWDDLNRHAAWYAQCHYLTFTPYEHTLPEGG